MKCFAAKVIGEDFYVLFSESGQMLARFNSEENVLRAQDALSNLRSDAINKIHLLKKEAFKFDEVYMLYPRKIGKQRAYEFLEKNIKTKEEYELLKEAVINYSGYCKREGVEERFIKHFSTFAHEWRDWAYNENTPKTPTNNVDLSLF